MAWLATTGCACLPQAALLYIACTVLLLAFLCPSLPEDHLVCEAAVHTPCLLCPAACVLRGSTLSAFDPLPAVVWIVFVHTQRHPSRHTIYLFLGLAYAALLLEVRLGINVSCNGLHGCIHFGLSNSWWLSSCRLRKCWERLRRLELFLPLIAFCLPCQHLASPPHTHRHPHTSVFFLMCRFWHLGSCCILQPSNALAHANPKLCL